MWFIYDRYYTFSRQRIESTSALCWRFRLSYWWSYSVHISVVTYGESTPTQLQFILLYTPSHCQGLTFTSQCPVINLEMEIYTCLGAKPAKHAHSEECDFGKKKSTFLHLSAYNQKYTFSFDFIKRCISTKTKTIWISWDKKLHFTGKEFWCVTHKWIQCSHTMRYTALYQNRW